MSDSLSLIWSHSVHFYKISDIEIFKRLLLPNFSSIFFQLIKLTETVLIGGGGIRAIFLVICSTLQRYSTLTISHLSYLACPSHKRVLVLSGPLVL